jgi:hypothetical protein
VVAYLADGGNYVDPGHGQHATFFDDEETPAA